MMRNRRLVMLSVAVDVSLPTHTTFLTPSLLPSPSLICQNAFERPVSRGRDTFPRFTHGSRVHSSPSLSPSLPHYQNPSRKGQLWDGVIPALIQHPGAVGDDLAVLNVFEDVGVELPALELFVSVGRGRKKGKEEGREGGRDNSKNVVVAWGRGRGRLADRCCGEI